MIQNGSFYISEKGTRTQQRHRVEWRGEAASVCHAVADDRDSLLLSRPCSPSTPASLPLHMFIYLYFILMVLLCYPADTDPWALFSCLTLSSWDYRTLNQHQP